MVSEAIEESKSNRDNAASPNLKQTTTDTPLTRPLTPIMLSKIIEGKLI